MTNGPVLSLVTIVTKDMEASVEFYRRLGVTVPDGDATWGPHHRSAEAQGGVSLDLDSQAFAPKWLQGWKPGDTALICFQMPSRESVDEAYAELTGAGYASQQEPLDAFWGARFAAVEDPDGNAVGLMSAIDPAKQSAPPDPPS
jgi:catechol 2,3-dioxygenase-like lactoylglutathione lyase family enzyme